MHFACRHGHFEIVKLLRARGVDVNNATSALFFIF